MSVFPRTKCRRAFVRAYKFAPALLVGFAAVLFCGCAGWCGSVNCGPVAEESGEVTKPAAAPIANDVVSRTIIIRGGNLANPSAIYADSEGVTVTSWSFANNEIEVTLAVADDAVLGAHPLTLIFGTNGNPTWIDSTLFYITCATCVPTPRLSNPAFPDGRKTIAKGETKTVRFHGREFLNNSPVVGFHPDGDRTFFASEYNHQRATPGHC